MLQFIQASHSLSTYRAERSFQKHRALFTFSWNILNLSIFLYEQSFNFTSFFISVCRFTLDKNGYKYRKLAHKLYIVLASWFDLELREIEYSKQSRQYPFRNRVHTFATGKNKHNTKKHVTNFLFQIYYLYNLYYWLGKFTETKVS